MRLPQRSSAFKYNSDSNRFDMFDKLLADGYDDFLQQVKQRIRTAHAILST